MSLLRHREQEVYSVTAKRSCSVFKLTDPVAVLIQLLTWCSLSIVLLLFKTTFRRLDCASVLRSRAYSFGPSGWS
jgi:hypothetical protein